MHIIVYNPYCTDAVEDARKVTGMLIERFGADAVKIKHHGFTVEIFDTRIDFRHGDVCKMAGTRPNYYCAWNQCAINFLECAAGKVNGKRLGNLEDIVKVIFEDRFKVTEVKDANNI